MEFGDHVPHPSDSSKFLVCSTQGQFIVMSCPGNLVFNRELHRCDHHETNIANPCVSNPCKNGGVCRSVDRFNFKCDCPTGFSGLQCESSGLQMDSPNMMSCLSNPCGHFHSLRVWIIACEIM